MARKIDGRTLTIDFSTNFQMASTAKPRGLEFQKDNPLSESGAQNSPQKSENVSSGSLEAGARESSKAAKLARTSSSDSERYSVVKAEGNQFWSPVALLLMSFKVEC